MKRWKQNLEREERHKSQRDNLLGLSNSLDSPNVIEMSDLGIKIVDARSIAFDEETSPLPNKAKSTLESNDIGMSELGIKIVETKSIAADTKAILLSTKKASASVITVMPKLMAIPPLGMMKIKVVKQNLLPAAATSPLKIRIKDPSSINSSVPETSVPLKTVSKLRNILPKTLTATVLQNSTHLTKEGTAFGKLAPPPPYLSSAFLRQKIVFPTKTTMESSDFIKFGTKSPQNTPYIQNLIEVQRDGTNDDIEIDHSQAELNTTEFGDFEEDIKPELSKLPKVWEVPEAHSLISKRKRKQKSAARADSNDSNCLSNKRAKSNGVETDNSSGSQNCSTQQKRAAQEPEELQLSISPQPKKFKVSQTTT
jgi:hypothetical protein